MATNRDWWLCFEYADDIYNLWRDKELQRLDFDCKSPQINWRPHFVQFLLNLAEHYDLPDDTLHLAVYIFDIFIDNHIIKLWRLHLVAYTSIRIASKIETINVPRINSLNMDYKPYPREDYNTLEIIMLGFFSWEVNVPTAAQFLSYFGEFIVNEDDFNQSRDKFTDLVTMNFELQTDAWGMVTNCLFSWELLYSMLPSKLAAVCIAGARSVRSIEPIWPSRLVSLTKYKQEDFKHELEQMLNLKTATQQQLETELEQMPLNRDQSD